MRVVMVLPVVTFLCEYACDLDVSYLPIVCIGALDSAPWYSLLESPCVQGLSSAKVYFLDEGIRVCS